VKIAPVSADMLIKLALVAASLGAIWYLTRRATQAVNDAVDSVYDTASTVWETVRPDTIINIVNTTADFLTTPDPTHRENGQYVLSKDR